MGWLYELEEGKEVQWVEEVLPGLPAQNNVSATVQTSLELLEHDSACGEGDVEGGVLLGVRWCDDGHQMEAVRRVDLWVDTGE